MVKPRRLAGGASDELLRTRKLICGAPMSKRKTQLSRRAQRQALATIVFDPIGDLA